jgi:hypothetical protein
MAAVPVQRPESVNLAGAAIEATGPECPLTSPAGWGRSLWYFLGMVDRTFRGASAGTGARVARPPGKPLIRQQVTLRPRALSGTSHGPMFRLNPLE